jgi:transmembrane sensor
MAYDERIRREAIKAEAARWLVRLADPSAVDEQEAAAFEAWRAQGPEYEAAYERERASWLATDRLRALDPGAGAPDPDLLAPRRIAEFAFGQRRAGAPRALRWAAAAAAVLVVAVTGVVGVGLLPDPAFATAIGERRVVVLDDGTRIELNTNTRIEVHYRHNVRQVRLVRGEALFEVRDDARPFVVLTPSARLGTARSELEVRLRATGTGVMVAQGAVWVRPAAPEAAAFQPTALSAGREGLYGADGGSAHAVSAEEIDRTLAWRQGAIDLHGQTLSEAVDEFNRYNTRRIVVADESISGLRLGGYFRTEDVTGFVQALRTTFPVKVASAADGTVYLSRAEKRD